MTVEDFSIIDVEGNEYKADYFKSGGLYPDLALNLPLKLTFLFKDAMDKPLFIKLFRFKTKSQPERNMFESIKSSLEFRDLKVYLELMTLK